MNRFGVFVGAVALSAICCMPATAMAGKTKVETTVRWTDVNPIAGPNNNSPFYFGQVSSSNSKCVSKRKLTILDDGDKIKVKANANGRFVATPGDFVGLPSATTKVTADPLSLGKKKACKSDSANASLSFEETTLNDLAFVDATNTFTGTIGTEEPFCAGGRKMKLFRDDGVNFTQEGSAFSSDSGDYSIALAGEPDPGQWSAITDDYYLASTFQSGNMAVTGCVGATSNIVTIGAG